MSDLDAEILALRVSGVSEREICRRFGCAMERVHAAQSFALNRGPPE
jgi:hypothetical protein